MGSSPEHMLLGDIGATNARLALVSKGLLGPIEWLLDLPTPSMRF